MLSQSSILSYLLCWEARSSQLRLSASEPHLTTAASNCNFKGNTVSSRAPMLIYSLSLSEKWGFAENAGRKYVNMSAQNLPLCPSNTLLFLQTTITTDVLSLEAMRKLFQSAWQAAFILLRWIEMKWILIGQTFDQIIQSDESVYRASVSGRMDVIYVRILLPYAETFDPGRKYVQLLSVTSAWCFTDV